MQTGLHLNLLKETERLSSSPVRLRILVPVLMICVAGGMLVWWGLLMTRHAYNESMKTSINNDISAKNKNYREAMKVGAEEKDLAAELAQIKLYEHGANNYATFFESMATVISPDIQIFDLNIQAPRPYNLRPDPRKPALEGQKETTEAVRMRLAGRTKASAPVNAMLKALQAPAFTNDVLKVEIPRGAFRQEIGGREGSSDMLLFEMNCDLKERRFE